MKALLLFTVSTCAWAQFNRPQLGKMLDTQGSARSVYGIAGSPALGEPELSGVLSYGCSKTLCLWKTAAGIVSPTGSAAAPDGPALFAFHGTGALVWFSQTAQLASWQNDALTFLDARVEGRVLAIGASAGAVQFAVERINGVWIVNQDGSAAAGIARTATAVMLTVTGPVYAERGEIVVNGKRFALDGVTAMFQMSADYLQVRAAGVDYALRIRPGRETLFQLPGVSQ
jgi:hypothetical protein